MPVWLPVEDFVELANVCEANGWTCHGVIFEPGNKWENLKNILAAGGAMGPDPQAAEIPALASARCRKRLSPGAGRTVMAAPAIRMPRASGRIRSLIVAIRAAIGDRATRTGDINGTAGTTLAVELDFS